MGAYERESVVVSVDIDVKPGSDPNAINPLGQGLIPVALLGAIDVEVSLRKCNFQLVKLYTMGMLRERQGRSTRLSSARIEALLDV